MGVGIADDHELMPGTAKAEVETVRLAEVDPIPDDDQPAIPGARGVGRGRGLVGGAVVEDQYLQLGIVAGEDGTDASCD
jgi:hypothetical protein